MSDSSRPPERCPLPVIQTWGPHSFLPAPESLVRSALTVAFEEKAGLVVITIHEAQGKVAWCELTAPQALSLGKTIPAQLVAAAASLSTEDIVTETHHPQVGSVGLPFVFAELRDRSTLGRARAHFNEREGLYIGSFPHQHSTGGPMLIAGEQYLLKVEWEIGNPSPVRNSAS